MMTSGSPILAVLDTNVVVSALISPGVPPARILGSVGRKVFVPLYDARIIAEYRDVLTHPRFGLASADIERFIGQLMNFGWAVEPTAWAGPMADESDHKFIEVARAVSGKLVTGNQRHFPDEAWVVSPAVFWTMLEDGA